MQNNLDLLSGGNLAGSDGWNRLIGTCSYQKANSQKQNIT